MDRANKPSSIAFQFSLAWLLAYLTVLGVVSAGLAYGRSQALAVYGGPEAQTQWNAWRADAERMAQGAGPVRRRAPKSLQPPALVLMRDHFLVCLALALVLTSVLFGTFMFFVRGALSSSRRVHERSEMHR